MDKTLKIALLLTAVDKMSGAVDKAVSKASKRLKAFNEFGNAAGIIGGAITGVYGAGISAARESELANKRLEQVFRSMGETNNKAAKSAEAYASKLEFQIGVEDEVIQLTQAKLATFKAVSNQAARMSGIFDRATQAAFDMASAGFGEADQNAVQLGKALQDPIKGINALRRSGITFTDAEKKKIATLVKSHKQLEAQKIILTAVEHQVGGVAAATADPIDKMKVGWTEVAESLGKAVLPAMQKVATSVGNFIPKIQSFIENNGKLVKVIGAVGIALLAVGTITKIVTAIMAVNPIILIIMAIAAAAILVITYWQPIKEFFIKIWDAICSFFIAAWNIIKKVIMFTPLGIIIKLWKPLTKFFSAIFKLVWTIIKAAIAAIVYIFLNFTPVGLIFKHWDKIAAFFKGIWDDVKKPFLAIVDWVFNLGKKFYAAGKNIVMSIVNGIKSSINYVTDAISKVTDKIRSYLPFSPAKAGALKDIHKIKLIETIAATIKPQPALKAMQRTTNAIAGFRGNAHQLQPLAVNNGGHTITIQQTFNGSVSSSDINTANKDLKTSVLKILRNEDKRKQRVSYSN